MIPSRLKTTLLFSTLLFLLGACSRFDQLTQQITQEAAGANDRELEIAITFLCDATSRGAVRRNFTTESQKRALETFCSEMGK